MNPAIIGRQAYTPTFGEKLLHGQNMAIRGQSYYAQTPNFAHNLTYDTRRDVQRFEIRNDEHIGADVTERSELSGRSVWAFGTDVWLAYSMCIEAGSVNTASFCVLGQFHATEDVGDIATSPNVAIELVAGDKLRAVTRGLPDPVQSANNAPTTIRWESSGSMRGAWVNVVARIVFGYANDGEFQLWINGQEVANATGAMTANNDLIGPYWKFGVYRATPASGETLSVQYANMEIGYADLTDRILSPKRRPL